MENDDQKVIKFKSPDKSMPKAKVRVQDTLSIEGWGDVEIEILRDSFVSVLSVGHLALLVSFDDNYKETKTVKSIHAFNMQGSPILIIGQQQPIYGMTGLNLPIDQLGTVLDHIIGSLIKQQFQHYLDIVADDLDLLPSIQKTATVI